MVPIAEEEEEKKEEEEDAVEGGDERKVCPNCSHIPSTCSSEIMGVLQ